LGIQVKFQEGFGIGELNSRFRETLEKMLNEGVNIVMDRYAYSGVAYSAAKVILCDVIKSTCFEKTL
jgi:thymidylate kinase